MTSPTRSVYRNHLTYSENTRQGVTVVQIYRSKTPKTSTMKMDPVIPRTSGRFSFYININIVPVSLLTRNIGNKHLLFCLKLSKIVGL